MKCPNCGKKLSFVEMTWQETLFWMCLITIAINQSAQFSDWVRDWFFYYTGRL